MRPMIPLLFLVASCADARDLFRPYHPQDREVQAMLARPMPAPSVDLGIALGCPAEPDGSISACERCRVDMAVALYETGAVKNLVFSGGAAHSVDVEADVMADEAERRGIPHEHVFREGRALTTWQNVRFSRAIARHHGYSSFVFISTSDHLPRARRIAEFYGFGDSSTGYRACDVLGSYPQRSD